jgi:hypothetical protein
VYWPNCRARRKRRNDGRAPASFNVLKVAEEGAARRAYSAAVRPALSWPKRRSI